MLIKLVIWWYGPGWSEALRDIRVRTGRVSKDFSTGLLLKTLFAPWRRIIADPGKGLEAKFRAMLDNLISRLVGFVVRCITLLAAGIMTGLTALICLLIAAAWPFIPLGIVYCIIRGVTG